LLNEKYNLHENPKRERKGVANTQTLNKRELTIIALTIIDVTIIALTIIDVTLILIANDNKITLEVF
jgi:hypothetical protein